MKITMKNFIYIFLLLIFICFGLISFAHTDELPPTFKRTQLTIKTAENKQIYDIELAISGQQQQYGLMYRKNLPENAGMLFIANPPRIMKMWMKNTLIPLDMLFIDKQGKIIYIEHDATPNSLKIISAGEVLSSAVLELAGGVTNKQKIKIGDEVIYNLPSPDIQH